MAYSISLSGLESEKVLLIVISRCGVQFDFISCHGIVGDLGTRLPLESIGAEKYYPWPLTSGELFDHGR